MPNHATDDIIVFLPGILGSVLEKDDQEVWGTSAGSIFRAVKSLGGSVSGLALERADDPTLDDLGDGVVATRLLPDTTVVPGFKKIDGYTKLRRNICDAFGLQQGKTAFDFPYDWRRDNRVAARMLKRAVDRWLPTRRQERPKAMVTLVAHSMGGLVSRYYLEVLGGWSDVRSLITFGTPYGGSPKALNFIVNGYRRGLKPFTLDLSPLLRSFDSVYQLLPTYECVDVGNGVRMIGDVPGMPHIDYERVAAALAFHDEIAAGVRARASAPKPHIAPVVGIEQPTLQAAVWREGQLEAVEHRQGKDESGDGTVPRISAVPFELGDAKTEVYVVETHASLQNHDPVLDHLRGVLSAPGIEIRRTRPGGPIGLALRMEDSFAPDEIITAVVRPSAEQPALKATLSAASGLVISEAPLRRQKDGTQRVQFDPVAEGNYRLRVEGVEGDATRVSSVTDVFMVAN